VPSPPSRSILVILYYGLLVALLAGILLQLLPLVLPDALAARVGRNSEGLLLALLVSLWIQWARPFLSGHPREWSYAAVAALTSVAVGLLLLASDLPSRFRTLNEAFLAVALLIPWLQLRRPLRRRLAVGIPLLLLLLVVTLHRTAAVTDLAEMLGALVLVPLALDVVDRGILDPSAVTSRVRRWAWYAFLVAAPIAFSLLQYRLGVPEGLEKTVRYLVRITEAFLFLLVVELWFAVGLGRTGRRPAAQPPRVQRPRPDPAPRP
jgi:hypothetical protein